MKFTTRISFTFLLIALFVLVGCTVEMTSPGSVPSTPTAQTDDDAATPDTDASTEGSTTDMPTTTPVLDADTSDADTDELIALFADQFDVAAGGEDGFEGIDVSRLDDVGSYPPLWIAHTYGIRPFDPLQNHVVALYGFLEGKWQPAAGIELDCPDYLNAESVQQVFINERDVWIEATGGTGAHSGCFDLLRWDGDALTIAASGFNSSPGAGDVVDVDGDGQPEVVLNFTEPYVFCYACGVRLYMADLLRWDGADLVTVQPTTLPEDAPADLRDRNNAAVELADASLFQDALFLIGEAAALAPDNETVYWNEHWIRLHAENRRAYAEDSPYPLLSWIFYGDWDAAVDQIRGYAPSEIFSPTSPLIVGTAAEGWEDALADYVIQFADLALGVVPDRAAAYFLRGWASFLQNPDAQAVIDNVETAAVLDPDDTLYTESLAYLQAGGVSDTPTAEPTAIAPAIPIPATVEPVRFASGATTHTLDLDLLPSEPQGFSLEISGGQTLYVTASAQTRAFLVDSNNQPVPSLQAGDTVQFDILATDVYKLILQGNGVQQVHLRIPPLDETGMPVIPPVPAQTIRFAPGASSAEISLSLEAGAPQVFTLDAAAGQRMILSHDLSNVRFDLFDPLEGLLTPRAADQRRVEYDLPQTGVYSLVVSGQGSGTLRVSIPPL